MTNSRRAVLFVLVLLVPMLAGADDLRASVNYKIHCQGCHLADASGLAGAVPRMKDFAAYFLYSTEGREFLIRVPGVATASLPDDQLAELMNWVLLTFSAEQLPGGFQPYTPAEVGLLRSDLVADPAGDRQRILGEISRSVPPLATELRQQGAQPH